MMTHERINELRQEVIDFRNSDDSFSEDVVTECLDEIERLDNIVRIQQKQIERLLAARDAEKARADNLQEKLTGGIP